MNDERSLLSRPRERLALAVLAPLLIACLAGAAIAPFHSGFGIDSRSHIEMIRGVSEHGLPYTTGFSNTDLETLPELQVAWNFLKDGRAWGIYPPVFSYVAAPIFKLGGLHALTRLCVLLLVPMLLGTFLLARRVLRDPIHAAVATYVVAATQIASMALDIGPFVLTVTLSTWATYLALVAVETRSKRAALIAGILGGGAIGAHLSSLPLVGVVMLLCFFMNDEARAPIVAPTWVPAWVPAHLHPWLPTRESVGRGAVGVAGIAIPLLAVSLVNHVRFGLYSPFTYGACHWPRRCVEGQLSNQNLGPMITFAMPPFLWCSGFALVVFLVLLSVRRSRTVVAWALALVGVAALVATYPLIRERTLAIASVAIGYTVDLHHLTEPDHTRVPDGLGTLTAAWVLKTPLQETPLLVLALLAPFATLRSRRTTVMLALPCLASFAQLSLRANLTGSYAMGWPFLFLRYVIPTLPLLAILAVGAVKDLPWRRCHVALLLGVAVPLLVALLVLGDGTDAPYLRRFFILRITLGAAALALVCTVAARARPSTGWKHAATAFATVAVAVGFGVGWGVDLPAMVETRGVHDAIMDRVAAKTPRRFALFGYAREIDIPLTLRATRDIEAADLFESEGNQNLRILIDYWTRTRRPIFMLGKSNDVSSPWKDVSYLLIDKDQHLFTVTMTR